MVSDGIKFGSPHEEEMHKQLLLGRIGSGAKVRDRGLEYYKRLNTEGKSEEAAELRGAINTLNILLNKARFFLAGVLESRDPPSLGVVYKELVDAEKRVCDLMAEPEKKDSP